MGIEELLTIKSKALLSKLSDFILRLFAANSFPYYRIQ